MILRRVAACWLAVAAAAAQAQAPAPAGSQDPERQLESIRVALVEAAVSAPVRVQSYGWIDAEGRLHESTQFSSDNRVRGVRLPSYVVDPAQREPARRLHGDSAFLPVGLGDRSCQAEDRRWRQGLHVEVVAGRGLPMQGPQAAHRVTSDVQRAFLAANRQSRRWVAQPRPYQATTAYERALVGREADRTQWLARIELSAAAGAIEAQVEVGATSQPTQARRLRVQLATVDSSAEAAAADIEAAMAGAVAELDRLSACDPLWYAVAVTGEGLRLREGAPHGLQAGDRLLLVERRFLPDRLLEPGAVRALALVQVGQSTDSGTTLQWLAGPRPPQSGDWVALPL